MKLRPYAYPILDTMENIATLNWLTMLLGGIYILKLNTSEVQKNAIMAITIITIFGPWIYLTFQRGKQSWKEFRGDFTIELKKSETLME